MWRQEWYEVGGLFLRNWSMLHAEDKNSVKKGGEGEWIRREMGMLPEKYHCGGKYRWNVMYKIWVLDLKKYMKLTGFQRNLFNVLSWEEMSYSSVIRNLSWVVFKTGFDLEDLWVWLCGLSFLEGHPSWESQKKAEAAPSAYHTNWLFLVANKSYLCWLSNKKHLNPFSMDF